MTAGTCRPVRLRSGSARLTGRDLGPVAESGVDGRYGVDGQQQQQQQLAIKEVVPHEAR